MPGPHMNAEELADELGRSTAWLYEGWPQLCKTQRMPHPLHGGQRPLVWSRAQVYAWIDRDLPPPMRLAAQAWRAAAAAIVEAPAATATIVATADWQARLDRLADANTVGDQ